MFASERYEKLFNVSKNGTVSVDDNGKSAFVSGKGEHRLNQKLLTKNCRNDGGE